MISETLKNKPILKHIAEEFLNYILTNEFQIYLSRILSTTPITRTVQKVLNPEDIKRFHLNEPDYYNQNYTLYKSYSKVKSKGYKKLWDRALKQTKIKDN